jgi:hypothetical protein
VPIQLMPDDDESRLGYVCLRLFGKRSAATALAHACGVSRTAVNKWPPGSSYVLDLHLMKAIDYEIKWSEDRLKMLREVKAGMRDRQRKYRAGHGQSAPA